MSVLSSLALLLTAAVHREQQGHMKKRAALWPELDGSAEELAKAKARIAELEDDIAAANAQARRDQDLIDMWRDRALYAVPAGPDFRPPQIAQQQAQMLQAQALQQQAYASQSIAQYNAQQAMNAQNYAHGLGQAVGLLGAQSLIDAELWCNCVPSRSQVWATSEPE